jgi:hypothetical protein
VQLGLRSHLVLLLVCWSCRIKDLFSPHLALIFLLP